METHESNKGCLNFTLFNIPICIRPSVWIVLALLGGVFQVNDGSDLLQLLIFVTAGMLTLLAHELGHALAGRQVTGSTPTVTLAMMGGVTRIPTLPRTRAQYMWYIAAGPLGSLLLGLVAALVLGLHIGDISAGISFYLLSPFGAESAMSAEQLQQLIAAIQEGRLSLGLLHVYATLMLVCMWWSLFNLLPILPMDGGQLLHTITGNIRLCAVIGIILSGILTILSVIGGMWLTMMLLGYFAYINWQILRDNY